MPALQWTCEGTVASAKEMVNINLLLFSSG